MNLNVVIITGRLAADPVLKTTISGKEICKINIAVQKNKNEVQFYPCVFWNSTAKFVCDYFKKGDGIAIRGQINYEPYATSDQGKSKYRFEIVAHDVDFAGKKKQGGTQMSEDDFEEIGIDDDVPF